MRTRQLGETDLHLSVIGLGSWAIGGSGWDYGWGHQEEKDSLDAIHEALECGINWIDTAAVYGLGRSEEVVGKALKLWKKPVIVATKCGLLANPDGSVFGCLQRKSILKEAEASLKRLQRDTIDLYQIHWPNPFSQIEEGFEALLDLKKQGKIRWAGVSNFSVKQMKKMAACGKIASLQPPYSLINRRVEKEILPWCHKNKVGVVTYSPLQCGMLTSKFSRAWLHNLPEEDWRKSKAEFFQEPQLSLHLELVEKLKNIAAKTSHTVSHLALSWVLRRNELTSVIVGARKKGQIREIAEAARWTLDQDQVREIESVLEYTWKKI
jgi:aryl-alcohol dehydrogenase-like predicted oxidoreductase